MLRDPNEGAYDRCGGFFQIHPVKQALRELGTLVPGLPCGDPKNTCSMIACPGGRCIGLEDEVRAEVAEMLGVGEILCFDKQCECTDGRCLLLSDEVRARFGLFPREKR